MFFHDESVDKKKDSYNKNSTQKMYILNSKCGLKVN